MRKLQQHREKFLLLGGRFVLTYIDTLRNMTTPENGCKKNSISKILFPGSSQADMAPIFRNKVQQDSFFFLFFTISRQKLIPMVQGTARIIAFFCQLFILFFFFLPLFPPALAPAYASSAFPLYKAITPNVAFWEKVYGTYTSRQGILHDKNDLAIIYGAVDLVDWNTPGAARINKHLIRLAREHYKDILDELASGEKPETRAEKRIAALFSHKDKKRRGYKKARDNIRLQIGQKDRFLQGVIRSGAYMPTIRAVFRKKKLPIELAYLPHVESSFNPRARSKVGAVGLWQFTRATGRNYMMINSLVDERYDPYVSSLAAAALLKKNHAQLGSWPLALTAYNYGRAGMVRALKKQKTYVNIFNNHQTGLFKFASKNFYSEFLAAMRVARRLEKNPAIKKDRPRVNFLVRLRGFTDFEQLRRYFRISRDRLIRLNPALRKPVLEGKKFIPKGYRLRLPDTRKNRQRAKKMGRRLYHVRQIRDVVYIVRRGDTISAISRKTGISRHRLIQANHLNRRAAIRVGQHLILPGKKHSARTGRTVILKDRAKYRP
jgi:membrane-bound lytic murein transglycosylase D